ncbi:Mycocerosic acid synthase-like polyketide synthase (MAS-like PKS) (Polyketide synthase Pks5) [Durusdinium trenchii]|uniref:Mycocerosic acid synthase-like polyketide synthase (MAS-like PKS) (Polyketide synthase Pks5) n=1 Tax=Durusdinium trenchii TaxID=1381693 RepID=A0ABP0I108_9DINO
MPAELLVSEIGHNLRFKAVRDPSASGHCVVKLGVDEDVLEQASDEAVDLKRAGKLQASALPSRADDETTPPQQLIDALLGPEGTNEYCRLDQLPEEGDEVRLRTTELDGRFGACPAGAPDRAAEDVEVGPELLGLNRRITKIAGASIAFCASEGYDNCSKSGEYLVRGGDYSDEVAELTEESCSEWLSLLNRARLMLVYIFGEGRGQLELLPFDEDSDSVEIATEPDMLVILRADQMHHKHQSSRGTFSILSWIMAAENSTTRGWTGGLSRTFGVTIPTARELVEWTQNRLKELLETEALDKDADIPRDWQLMMRHSFFRNNRSPVAVRGEAGHMPTTNNNRVLWDAINQGSDFVTDVPYHRWDHELYYDADPNCWMQAGRNRYFAARLEERKRDLGILQRS